jgi:hypothetical protein
MSKVVCSFLFYLLVSAFPYARASPILLISEVPTGPVRGPSSSVNVTAVQSDGQVKFTFASHTGWFAICIKNIQGEVVYQAVVDTAITSGMVIDTASWPSGNYLLTLTPETGNQLSREFSL